MNARPSALSQLPDEAVTSTPSAIVGSLRVSVGAAVERGLTTGVSALSASTVPPLLLALSSMRIRKPTSAAFSVYEPFAFAVTGTQTLPVSQRCQLVVTAGVGLPDQLPAVCTVRVPPSTGAEPPPITGTLGVHRPDRLDRDRRRCRGGVACGVGDA